MPRPFSTKTVLGQRMAVLGFTASEFSAITGIYTRTLTEYLAGRRQPTDEHLHTMASVLGMEADELVDH